MFTILGMHCKSKTFSLLVSLVFSLLCPSFVTAMLWSYIRFLYVFFVVRGVSGSLFILENSQRGKTHRNNNSWIQTNTHYYYLSKYITLVYSVEREEQILMLFFSFGEVHFRTCVYWLVIVNIRAIIPVINLISLHKSEDAAIHSHSRTHSLHEDDYN